MPKGYWIAHLDVSNPEGFQAYRETADAGHKRFGSKLLARGGRREVVEGKMRARNVLREFNSYDEALAYYRGADYSNAHKLREGQAACDFLIVEGYEGPQPPPVGTPPAPGRLNGYWIAHIDIFDSEGYKPYQAANATAFGKYGGRFLVRGGRAERMEGRVRSRSVVVEFPSYEAALACYRSPEYQAAMALRQGKGETDLVVISGYEDESSGRS
jgi:uncharacterized protein (DUF1330 family)